MSTAANQTLASKPVRPERLPAKPVPDLPLVGASDDASTVYSRYRTKLSNHRTGLSEHRTSLSEYRTDLSTQRTDMSTGRTEMSMRRTGMSFQRTRLSAERTLMSIIRTSLALISFGFTIHQVFQKLQEADVLASARAPRNFGIALVALGIGMLALGIIYHGQFMLALRNERGRMTSSGHIHGESPFPTSLTLIIALALLLLGIFAILSITLSIGPLG